MLNVQRLLDDSHSPARLLLQIHDELVLECPQDAAAELIPQIRECMEGAMLLNVPLVVDVTTGPSWLDQRDAE
jgi:DNA polymerase-1